MSAVAGIALSGIAGSSLLAEAGIMPGNVPATDSQGRPQRVSQTGINLIEQFEGLELKGYVLGDGMCTIGYGHAVPISQKPSAECKQWTITNAEAEAFLKEDTERFANELNTYFNRSFTQNQFDALVSFSYNLGYVYEKYDWPTDAPDNYFPGVMKKYVNPPQFREGLTRRRNAEIELFVNPSEPAADEGPSEPAEPMPTEVVIAPALEEIPIVDVPAVVVTQYPEITHLFSGGISAR